MDCLTCHEPLKTFSVVKSDNVPTNSMKSDNVPTNSMKSDNVPTNSIKSDNVPTNSIKSDNVPNNSIKVNQSHYRPDRPRGFQKMEAPRFQDNRHMKVVRLPALRTPENIPGTHFR
jgi:hypothetical protein